MLYHHGPYELAEQEVVEVAEEVVDFVVLRLEEQAFVAERQAIQLEGRRVDQEEDRL